MICDASSVYAYKVLCAVASLLRPLAAPHQAHDPKAVPHAEAPSNQRRPVPRERAEHGPAIHASVRSRARTKCAATASPCRPCDRGGGAISHVQWAQSQSRGCAHGPIGLAAPDESREVPHFAQHRERLSAYTLHVHCMYTVCTGHRQRGRARLANKARLWWREAELVRGGGGLQEVREQENEGDQVALLEPRPPLVQLPANGWAGCMSCAGGAGVRRVRASELKLATRRARRYSAHLVEVDRPVERHRDEGEQVDLAHAVLVGWQLHGGKQHASSGCTAAAQRHATPHSHRCTQNTRPRPAPLIYTSAGPHHAAHLRVAVHEEERVPVRSGPRGACSAHAM